MGSKSRRRSRSKSRSRSRDKRNKSKGSRSRSPEERRGRSRSTDTKRTAWGRARSGSGDSSEGSLERRRSLYRDRAGSKSGSENDKKQGKLRPGSKSRGQTSRYLALIWYWLFSNFKRANRYYQSSLLNFTRVIHTIIVIIIIVVVIEYLSS